MTDLKELNINSCTQKLNNQIINNYNRKYPNFLKIINECNLVHVNRIDYKCVTYKKCSTCEKLYNEEYGSNYYKCWRCFNTNILDEEQNIKFKNAIKEISFWY